MTDPTPVTTNSTRRAQKIRRALELDLTSSGRKHVIDITTTGAKSGLPRRIEIWFHHYDGHWYISGTPGPKGWYANLLKNPEFVFHLKHGVRASLAATVHQHPAHASGGKTLCATYKRNSDNRTPSM